MCVPKIYGEKQQHDTRNEHNKPMNNEKPGSKAAQRSVFSQIQYMIGAVKKQGSKEYKPLICWLISCKSAG